MPSAIPDPENSGSFIAPAWHSAAVLLLLLGFSFVGARVELPALFPVQGRAVMYLLGIVMEWAVVGFIAWGLARRGGRLSDLVGDGWTRPINVLRDLGIALAFLIVVGGFVMQGLAALLRAAPTRAVGALLPQTHLEMILWVLLSVTGGFCEEVIYRGYLQRQFSALTRSLMGGIALQAAVFGLSHGYQGWKLMFIIALYGAGFGLLAQWRRSLRPGILAHALQDIASGLLARVLLR
jgi:membrane protease YdiL (CAAX protease family)